MELDGAIEELRVADREALAVLGDLEQNWKDAFDFLQSRTPLSFRLQKGRIRWRDLASSIDDLELVEARIAGLAGDGRRLPSRPSLDTPPLPGRPLPVLCQHLHRVHAAMWQAHTTRVWIREVASDWGQPSAFGALTFEDEDAERRQHAAAYIPTYTVGLIVSTAIGVAVLGGIAAFVATAG